MYAVSYQVVTQESAEHGDAASAGMVLEDATLRDAIAAVFETRTSHVSGVECVECDEWPVTAPRWITVTNGMEYHTGAHESRSLHMPENLTPSSRRRIARLCGVNV